MLIAYAKGARSFERHIDIEYNDKAQKPSEYCSLPADFDRWVKAYQKAKELCGTSGEIKRIPTKQEIEYLNSLVRGVYAKRDFAVGETLTDKDVYLAVPLQKGQISCRELMSGEALIKDIKKDSPIMIDDIDSPYAFNEGLKERIYSRGL